MDKPEIVLKSTSKKRKAVVNTTAMDTPVSLANAASLRFYTSLEVAEILKMHPQVITRKLQAGEISGYKLGKDWRVSEAQLFEFLDRHSNRGTSVDPATRVLDTFIVNGKLKSIPVARSKRLVVLEHLVSKLDPQKVYEESELNQFLQQFHPDVCTLRREFIMNKLMVRKNGKYKIFTSNQRS